MSNNTHTITIKAITAQAKNAIGSVQNSVDDMISTIERNRDGIESLGIMSGVAFAGLSMGIKSAVSTFADFEATMSGVKAVLNPTEEEFKKLTEQAEILGATTKFSALETAEGTEMLARNGLNAQQILGGALEATLNLAAATGTDIATAADIATDAMASFWLQTENLGQVMNSITGVTNASKFAIEDYKYALAAGGGVAAALGVELEDFNTVIAATWSRFAGGSDAGTSFKTFMQRLVPASKEAMGAMKDLWLVTFDNKKAFDQLRDLWIKPASDSFDDISKAVSDYAKKMKMTEKQVQKFWQELWNQNEFYTAEWNLKSMAEISELLKEATKDLSEEQKNQALSTIFGSDALRTAMGLAEVGAEKFTELQKSIEWTDASENAKTRMDNLKGTFEELGGAVDSVKIALGRSLAPAIKQVTIFFQDIAQKIGVWVAKNPELASTIMVVATAVTGIIAVMTGLALAIWPIFAGFGLLKNIILALIPSFTTIITVVKTVGVAISFLASPIGIIIALIVGLVAVIFFNWDLIKNFTIETFESIKNFLSETFENIKNIGWEFIYNLVEQFVILWESIKTTTENIWNGIITFLSGIWENIKTEVVSFGEAVKNIWNNFWNSVKSIWENILNEIVGFIVGIWENIKSGVTNFGENIKQIWESIWNGLTDFIRNIFNGNTLAAAGEALWNIANKALEWGANMIEMFKQGVQRKWGEFKAWVSESAGVLADFFGFHSPTKKWPNSDADKWMPNFIKMLTDGIRAGKWDLENSIENTAKAFTKINKWLKVDEIKKAFKQMQKDAEQTFDSVASDAEKSKKKIEKFKDEIEKISNKIQDLKNKMEENDDDFKVNISDRYFDVQEKLQDLNNKDKKKDKDLREIEKLEEELKLIQSTLSQEEIDAEIKKRSRSETQKMIDAYEKKQAKLEGEIIKQELLQKEKERWLKEEEDLYKQLIQTKTDLENEYFSLFQQNLDKTKTGIQSAISMMQTLRAMSENTPVDNSSNGGLPFGGAFASGGSVSVGKQYLVGERWPELFVPSTNGYIVPNNQISGAATININMGGVVVTGEADENRLVEKISQKLTRDAKLYKLWIA